MKQETITAWKGGRKYTFTKSQWENIKAYPKMRKEFQLEETEVEVGGLTIATEILNHKKKRIEELKNTAPVIAEVVSHNVEVEESIEGVVEQKPKAKRKTTKKNGSNKK